MRLAARDTWKQCKQIESIKQRINSFSIHDRVCAGIALDQFYNRPELGEHSISKNKIKLANDDRTVFFGKTEMGLYSISWVVHHFLEIPIIIDVSTEMHANIHIPRLFYKKKMPKMIPFVVN